MTEIMGLSIALKLFVALIVLYFSLRIFKAGIVIIGFFAGCMAAFLFQDFYVDTVSIYYVIPVFALIGSILAWMLQKVLVSAVSGAFLAYVGCSLLAATGIDPNFSTFPIVFLGGGLLSFYLYGIVYS